MSETLTIRKKAGVTQAPHQVASGQGTVTFEGDGPWQVPAADWQQIAWTACEWFEPAPDAPKTKKPAVAAESKE
jgi:hypothetical protein